MTVDIVCFVSIFKSLKKRQKNLEKQKPHNLALFYSRDVTLTRKHCGVLCKCDFSDNKLNAKPVIATNVLSDVSSVDRWN